jgi:hypothetical protein
VTVRELWQRLPILTGVRPVKITRVLQRDGRVRFDIFVARMRALALCMDLRKVSKTERWFVRLHRPYHLRRRPVPPPGHAAHVNPPAHRRLRIVSWNINGLQGKMAALRVQLREERVDVLCLQETQLLGSIGIPGYHVVSRALRPGPGRRGLLVAVRDGLSFTPVGPSDSDFVQCVLVTQGQYRVIVGCVYIPTAGDERKEAWKALRFCLPGLRAGYPDVPMAFVGDFNTRCEPMRRQLEQRRTGLVLHDVRGSPITWHGRRRVNWSALDHVLVDRPLAWTSVSVLRQWEGSDHWPVASAMAWPAAGPRRAPQDQTGVRLDHDRLPAAQDNILRNNRFAALAPLIEDEPDTPEALDVVCDKFMEACVEVAMETDVCKHPAPRHRSGTPGLSKRTIKALQRTRALACQADAVTARAAGLADLADELEVAARQEAPPEEVPRPASPDSTGQDGDASSDGSRADPAAAHQARILQEYSNARRVSRRLVRAEQAAKWRKHIHCGVQLLRTHKSRAFWHWAKNTLRHGTDRPAGQAMAMPVRDGQGRLQVDPQAILAVWAEHYGQLASDVTGHSRDVDYWRALLLAARGPPAAALPGLSEPVTWAEVSQALWSLHTSTAPGGSGFTPEWYRLAAEDEIAANGLPTTEMGRVVFGLVRWMVWKGHVPQRLNTAAIVSIPKSGDLSDPSNYRGIALIECVTKVATALLLRRVVPALEASGALAREQAGFRAGEESTGQAVALYELLLRRLQAKKRTYVLFVDLKKAYDTVPQGAMLAKLEWKGVTGRALAFFAALYENARLQVRLPCGASPAVPILRGLRQGCPASPSLFNVFIDDLAEVLRPFGVSVPGLNERVCGFLFADDLAIVAKSTAQLKRAARALTRWLDQFEMSVGIAKCGVMGIGDGAAEVLARSELQVQGQVVPVVQQYRYLGLEIFADLDLYRTAGARVQSTRAALWSVRAFVRNTMLPLDLRLRMFKATVVSVARFGGELLGMRAHQIEPIQSVLNEGLRWLAGCRSRNVLCAARVLWIEMGVPPLAALMAGARLRGYTKWPNSLSWIGVLRQNPPPAARTVTWVSGTLRWIRRWCPTLNYGDAVIGPERSPRMWAHLVMQVTAERLILDPANKPRSLNEYLERQLELTRGYIKHARAFPSLARGVGLLLQMRAGCFWTAFLAARSKVAPGIWLRRCPGCLEDVPETVEHFLWECPRWQREREPLVAAMWEQVPGCAVYSSSTVATMLCGGRVAGTLWEQFLPDGVQNGMLDVDGQPLFDDVAFGMEDYLLGLQNVDGDEGVANYAPPMAHDNAHPAAGLSGYLLVARFLQQVHVPHRKLLDGVFTKSRGPLGYDSL